MPVIFHQKKRRLTGDYTYCNILKNMRFSFILRFNGNFSNTCTTHYP